MSSDVIVTPQVVSATDADIEDDFGDPTMLGPDDLALYQVVAGKHESGIVVEIGPWLGGSTRAAAHALEKAGRPWRLFAVDGFNWLPYHHERFGPLFALGESFLHRFEKNTAEFGGKVTAVAGNYLHPQEAIAKEPIGTLLIDGPRSWNSLRTVLERYAAQLQTGSRIVLEGVFVPKKIDMTLLMLQLPVRLEYLSASGSGGGYVIDGDLRAALSVSPARFEEADLRVAVRSVSALANVLPISKTTPLVIGLYIELLRRKDEQTANDLLQRYAGNPLLREAAVASVKRLHGSAKGEYKELTSVLLSALQGSATPRTPPKTPALPTPPPEAKTPKKLSLPDAELARLTRLGQTRGEKRSLKSVLINALSLNRTAEAQSPSDALDRASMQDVLALGQGIGAPQTLRELAVLFASNNPTANLSAVPDIEACLAQALASPDFATLLSLRPFLAGRRVLDFAQPSAERAITVKSIGALEYFGVVAPGTTLPAALPIGGIAFGPPADSRGFDVGLDQVDGVDALIERIAMRLQRLAPGGRLLVTLLNPRGALAGRKGWESGLATIEHAPNLADIQQRLEANYEIFTLSEEYHSPKVVAGIDPSLVRRHGLHERDLIVKRLVFGLSARQSASQSATQPLRPFGNYARRKSG